MNTKWASAAVTFLSAVTLGVAAQAKELDRVVFLEAHPDDLASEMGTAVLMKQKEN